MRQQAELGLLTPHLMPPDDAALAMQLRVSRPGMAHFGATGPDGKTCRECRHWGRSDKYRRLDGVLCPRRCQQFSRMMDNANGAGIPHSQVSCRHFDQAKAAPAAVKKRKKKASADA